MPPTTELVRPAARPPAGHEPRVLPDGPEPRPSRDADTSRLQGFSDGVFALSATLLVVTIGAVPGSYEELVDAVARFPAFAVAFAGLVSLWWNHRQFFAVYPLADGVTAALNGVLLLIVLLYVYPLKLLAEVVSERFLGAAADVTVGMGAAETRGLFLLFGVAVFSVTLTLAALHLRAWRLRDALGLDALGRYELRQEIVVYAAIALVPALSMLLAALWLGLAWGLPFWIYGLSPAVVVTERSLTARRRAELARACA